MSKLPSCPRSFSLLALACLILVLVSTVISLLLYATSHGDSRLAFPLISKLKMLPPFADLRWITSNSECSVDLAKLATGMAWGCDPYGRGGSLPYPPFSVQVARFLSIKGSHTSILALGWGLAALSIPVIMCLRRLGLRGYSYMFAALLISGLPLQLAVERANIDLGIFLLIASLSAFVAIDSFATAVLAAIISWLVVGVKAFPALGILTWVSTGFLKDIKVTNRMRLFVVGGVIAGLSSILPWIMGSGKDIPKPEIGHISHGLLFSGSSHLFREIFLFLQAANLPAFLVESLQLLPIVTISFFVLGGLMGLGASAAASLRDDFSEGLHGFENRFLYFFVSISGLVWLGCYVLTSNYDYRMIFAYPSFLYIAYWCSSRFGYRKNSFVASSLFIGMILACCEPLLSLLLLSSSHQIFLYVSLVLSTAVDLFFLPFLAGFIASFCLPVDIASALKRVAAFVFLW